MFHEGDIYTKKASAMNVNYPHGCSSDPGHKENCISGWIRLEADINKNTKVSMSLVNGDSEGRRQIHGNLYGQQNLRHQSLVNN